VSGDGAVRGWLADDLARYGPQSPQQSIGLVEAQAYCRNLARTHYENFSVVSWLVPKHLRQHFANVYAYCRWADDLADEVSGEQQSLELLDWWQGQLVYLREAPPRHPVFIALRETIERYQIPTQYFADLLVAFRQDQAVTRYETFDELLAYCRCSANPVGRIVLRLGESFSEENAALSDLICTGLQLANFCQDVARDWQRGRVYLPLDDCHDHGYLPGDAEWGQATDRFRSLLQEEVARARSFLAAGEPLPRSVRADLRFQVECFRRGGLAILDAIEAQRYEVWRRRPHVSRWEKLRIAATAWWSLRSSPSAG
jgi:squalene synthase HpnC